MGRDREGRERGGGERGRGRWKGKEGEGGVEIGRGEEGGERDSFLFCCILLSYVERLGVRNFNVEGVAEVTLKQFALIPARTELRNISCRKPHLNCKTLGL